MKILKKMLSLQEAEKEILERFIKPITICFSNLGLHNIHIAYISPFHFCIGELIEKGLEGQWQFMVYSIGDEIIFTFSF